MQHVNISYIFIRDAIQHENYVTNKVTDHDYRSKGLPLVWIYYDWMTYPETVFLDNF